MNYRKLAKLEKQAPARGVAALNAATQRAIASGVPRITVIGDGLYRVTATGEKELIRELPPRAMAPGRIKRSQT